ncbi:MAG: LmbE family protein [Patescibacteria group bacterium]|jgi:LmbE family N-acetylglucosaminyl deacetylase|nr:LmbE family protein [Patescibacteria group bacterium]
MAYPTVSRRGIIVGLILGIVLATLWWFLSADKVGNHGLDRYGRFPALQSDDRITVVSPHLDDETLGLGGFISQAREANIPVSVIFMTNGDDNPIGADLEFSTGYATPEQRLESGRRRQEEAIKALAGLGVPETSLYFLGLPDRGLGELTEEKYEAIPYRAPGTLQTTSTYERTYIKNLSYTGQAVRTALSQAISETNPTLLFTTMPEDGHRDHAASATLLNEALPTLSTQLPELYYFLIHYKQYPYPKGVDNSLFLLPPPKLMERNWKVVTLDADDIASKQQAVDDYPSQLRIPFLGKLMKSFVRTNELVIPATPQ